MLNIPSTVSIFLYTEPTDMRKSFDGLSGLVRAELGADPTDGTLVLFINRRGDRLKLLHFDGAGYWLYYRLLEAGTFEVIAAEGNCVRIDATQLAMLLGGVSLVGVKRRPACCPRATSPRPWATFATSGNRFRRTSMTLGPRSTITKLSN
jgi:transposase